MKITTELIIPLFVGLVGLSGCGGSHMSYSASSLDNHSDGAIPPVVPAGPETEALGICSRLDFTGISWPTKLIVSERKAMALSLNITGSFEGSAGWTNISNNFDGQGLSLGLNQQNLGQGSLQPLLTNFLKTNLPLAKSLFSAVNLSSLAQMLNAYSSNSVTLASAEQLFPNRTYLSPLDNPDDNVRLLSAQTDASVAWAKANLFLANGTTFKSDWKSSLVAMAASAPYRSLQTNAAFTIFAKASAYFDYFKFKELRSLLFMYDIVVQNGSFGATHQQQFADYDKANPNATETQRLLKLLAIRVVDVRDQYKSDVLARKTTIINGAGVVHSTNRNLQKEYCYSSNELVDSSSGTLP